MGTYFGHVKAVAPINKVQYTYDRRVPILILPFNSNTTGLDNEQPVSATGSFSYAACKVGNGILINSSTQQLYYDAASEFSVLRGTIEFFFKPTYNYDDNAKHVFISIDAQNRPKSFQIMKNTDNKLQVSVMNHTGSYVDCISTSGAVSWTANTVHHIRVTWEFNKDSDSYIKTYLDGTEVGTTTTTITVSNKLTYTNLWIGRDSTTAGNEANSIIENLRISDIVQTDVQHNLTAYSCWVDTTWYDISPDNDSTQASFSVTCSPASGEVALLKVRSIDIAGNRQTAEWFNLGKSTPHAFVGTLVATTQPGSYGGGGDDLVYRFKFIDAAGQFADYEVPINPTAYTNLEEDTFLSYAQSLDGGRRVGIYKRAGESRSLLWDRITKTFRDELVKRGTSGNPFYLIDHNGDILYGMLQISNLEEIISTVPSEYRLNMKFTGLGVAVTND